MLYPFPFPDFVLVRAFDRRKLNLISSLTSLSYGQGVDAAPTITATIHDPDGEVLEAHRFTTDKKGKKRGELFFDRDLDGYLDAIDVTLSGGPQKDKTYRLTNIGVGNDTLELEFQVRSVARLRNKFKHIVAKRGKGKLFTRAEFVRRLVKDTDKDMPFYPHGKLLHEWQPIDENDEPESKARRRRRPSGAGKGEKVGAFNTTAYGPPWNALNGSGTTAGGTNLHDGKRRYIVAADPDVLPLGTHVYIDPNPYNYDGTFLVDDTGGAINGNRIDFYVAEGRSKQLGWGRRRVNVWRADGKEAGGSDATTTTKELPYQFKVGKNESYWDAIVRMASEVRWRAFVHDGVFYFMDDYQLIRAKPQYTLDRRSPNITNFEFQVDGTKKFPSEATLTALTSDWEAYPGDVIDMIGAGMANGRWLVKQIEGDYFSPQISVTLYQPQKALKEPPNEVETLTEDGSDSTPNNSDSGAIGRMVAKAKSIKKSNPGYVWGGGHASAGTPSGGGYDCSGAVAACLVAGGFIKAGSSVPASGTMMSWGKPGPGKHATIYAHSGHVFMILPGGRIDTHGTDGRFVGWHPGGRSTAGFVARHFEGM